MTIDRENDPHFWNLEKRLNLQKQGLYQPFPHFSDRQFVELLDGSSPISDWFLFQNQFVTPDERQAALQRLAEHKGMDHSI